MIREKEKREMPENEMSSGEQSAADIAGELYKEVAADYNGGKKAKEAFDRDDLSDIVLPDEAINRIVHTREKGDDSKWAEGRLAVELVDEYGKRYGKGRLRKKIGIEAGYAAATIRDREAMARFFNEAIVEDYGVLSYSQMKACKAAGPDGWKDLADWAVESADDFGGRPAPVDAINMKRRGIPRDDPTWIKQAIRVFDLCEVLLGVGEVPEGIAKGCRAFIRHAGEDVDGLQVANEKEE